MPETTTSCGCRWRAAAPTRTAPTRWVVLGRGETDVVVLVETPPSHAERDVPLPHLSSGHRAATQLPGTFRRGQPAPHAVAFVRGEGVVGTLAAHRAAGADALGQARPTRLVGDRGPGAQPRALAALGSRERLPVISSGLALTPPKPRAASGLVNERL